MKTKLFINIIIIFFFNLIFKEIISSYTFEINTSYLLKTFSKVILTLLVLNLIIKNDLLKNKILFNKNFVIIPLSLFLIYLSHKVVLNYALNNNIKMNYVNEFFFFVSCLSVGIFEELFFRVFVFNYIAKNFITKINGGRLRIIKIIIITSLLFGIAHLSNLLNYEYNKISVINQILLAFSLGILLQSLFIRYKNIYLIIFIHTIINFLGSFKSKLFNIYSDSNNLESTINDFYQTLFFLFLVNIFLIIPLSYILIKQETIEN